MKKSAKRLMNASLMTDFIQEVMEPVLDREIADEINVTDLDKMWEKSLEWLFENRHRWSKAMMEIMEGKPDWQAPASPLSFQTLFAALKAQEGGRFLNYRVLRQNEAHRYRIGHQTQEIACTRYVLMDGTHDIAEVVEEEETRIIKWIMTYRSQNLVHLLEAAIKNDVKLIT